MEANPAVREALFAVEAARKQLLKPQFIELGLTIGQGQPRILSSLLKKENITQKELAQTCHLDVTTLSRVLDHMQKAGLILRQKDPECRRSWHILLTERGRETAFRVQDIFTDIDRRICLDLEETEISLLLELLEKIKTKLS